MPTDTDTDTDRSADDHATTEGKGGKGKQAGGPASPGGGGGEYPAAAVYLELDSLKPWPDNPRDLTDSIPVIKRSLKAFGFGRPIIAWGSDGARRIVVGHGTTEAYRQLLREYPDWKPDGVPKRGLVPVRWRNDWSEKEASGYALADNRTAEFSLWDEEKLRKVATELAGESFAPDMGWDQDDLNALLAPPDDGDGKGGGVPNVVIQYNIVFDNEEQQGRWYKFVRWLRDERADDGDTIGSRLDAFISDQLAAAGVE